MFIFIIKMHIAAFSNLQVYPFGFYTWFGHLIFEPVHKVVILYLLWRHIYTDSEIKLVFLVPFLNFSKSFSYNKLSKCYNFAGIFYDRNKMQRWNETKFGMKPAYKSFHAYEPFVFNTELRLKIQYKFLFGIRILVHKLDFLPFIKDIKHRFIKKAVLIFVYTFFGSIFCKVGISYKFLFINRVIRRKRNTHTCTYFKSIWFYN